MSQLERDILLALIAGLPALILAILAWRKAPAEIDAAEAAADKAQHDATKSIAEGADVLSKSLRVEIENLKADLAEEKSKSEIAIRFGEDLQRRLTNAEERLARAEARATEAEKRSLELRSDLVKVGTMLDEQRKKHQQQIDELVLIIQTLLEQVEGLGGKPNIDREVLERIANLSRKTNGWSNEESRR